MTTTEDLIRTLSRDVKPVRRLPSAGARGLGWFALAVPAVVLVGLYMEPEVGVAARLADPGLAVTLAASLATSVCAVLAAMILGVPGRSRRWVLLPLPPLVVWLAGFGRQCVLEWSGAVDGELLDGPHLSCLPDIVVMTVVPTIAMVVLARRAAWFEGRLVLALGGLAAAALANAALSLVHPQDAGLLVLMVQFLAVSGLSLVLGRPRQPKPFA